MDGDRWPRQQRMEVCFTGPLTHMDRRSFSPRGETAACTLCSGNGRDVPVHDESEYIAPILSHSPTGGELGYGMVLERRLSMTMARRTLACQPDALPSNYKGHTCL